MKRIAHFIKWVWDKWDAFGKVAACYLTFWALPSLITCFWIGKFGLLLAACGILVFFLGALLVAVGNVVLEMWNDFNRENPPDDVRIVNRLKGID